ncbi:MAG: glycosyltransferase family 4 protein [Chloroflexota bacterium]|nr:glycosyltransferase family 4 protein [Chloroflexota bacterium]
MDRLHIVFITPYYPPEVGAPQTRISETAARLVQRGHTVTVLTTHPNYPSGVVPPAYRGLKMHRERREGVEIIRVWSYISPNKGFLRRILAQLSFGCLSPLLGGRHLARPDMLIVESPPLFDAFAGRLLALRYHCPYIFTVADIWPESAVQLGALRNRLLIWLAERLEWSAYTHAARVWAVTGGIREALVRRGLPAQRVFLLPNGVDVAAFRPMAKAEARTELGWEHTFTLLYAGTIGMAHGLHIVLDAAEKLRGQPDIRIVLAGEGALKADLLAAAARRQLTHVTFIDARPHKEMPTLIAASDVCLASLRKLPLFEGALPSKMYEAMACARPLLLAVDGEARTRIEQEAGAALYVEPENAQALADAIVHLRDNPTLAEQLGERGRQYVKTHFNRDLLVRDLETRIVECLDADTVTYGAVVEGK